MEIEIRDPADYGIRSEGEKLVFVRAMMSFHPESLQLEYQRSVGARMLRQLSEVMPFLEQHVLEVYPEFRVVEGSRDKPELQDVYGFASLNAIPENLRCLSLDYSKGVGSRSGIEGLFVATGESFPEYGSFGGTIAALEAVSWLAHRAGLAGPFV